MSFESSHEAGGSGGSEFSVRHLFLSGLSMSGCQGFGTTPQALEYLASVQGPAGESQTAEQTGPLRTRFRDTEDIRWLQKVITSGDDLIELIDPEHNWHTLDHCKTQAKD